MALLFLLLLLCFFFLPGCRPAFVARPKKKWVSSLSGLKNKQADLARKMELAKQQQAEKGTTAPGGRNNKQAELARRLDLAKQKREEEAVSSDASSVVTPREDTEAMQQEEFKRLLAHSHIPKEPKRLPEREDVYAKKKTSARTIIPSTLTSPKRKKNKRKTKTVIPRHTPEGTVFKQKEGTRAFTDQLAFACQSLEEEDTPVAEGERAHRRHFEPLLTVPKGSPLGPIAAARLVPWVPPFLQPNLIVIADPRRSSGDWRQALQYVASTYGAANIVGITAETPDKTSSWLQRSGVEISVLSDPNLDWMKTYAKIDEDRWSLSLLVFEDGGTLLKAYRDVEPSKVCGIVSNYVGKGDGKT